MKKLNLKSLFRKVSSSTALNRLIDFINNKIKVDSSINNYTNTISDQTIDISLNQEKRNIIPHFPEIENIKDEKEKVKVLMEHIKNIDPEHKLILIENLKKINTLNNKVYIDIIEALSKDTARYKIDNESKAWILSSETFIDKAIYYFLSCDYSALDAVDIVSDAITIGGFYDKNNWIRYETKGLKMVNDNELLEIELSAIYQGTLSDDTTLTDINIRCIDYDNMCLCKIQDNTNEKNNFYIAFIPEINEIILKCEGVWNSNIGNKTELNFSIAETYMRIAHKININPLVIRYDTSQFKVNNNQIKNNSNNDQNMHPIANQLDLKSWQVKTIELANIQSAQSLSIKLKVGIEYVGMSQLWMFFSTLGDIKDLHCYNVNKINIIMEVNDSKAEKGYDKISITINEKNTNLNMMILSHQKAYKILLDSDVSLGFVE